MHDALLITGIIGALLMACFVATVCFLRFYVEMRDRLFVFFAVAFALLSLSWLLVAIYNPTKEVAPYFYLPRLGAFLIILYAIFDKNRDRRL